jgi:hypothetical protein
MDVLTVTRKPLEGLGSDVKTIQRMCSDDSAARGLIEEELKKEAKHGGDHGNQYTGGKIDIINLATPDGTSRDQALRALRKHNPAIYKEVISGKLSAHAGMIKAGLRRGTFDG